MSYFIYDTILLKLGIEIIIVIIITIKKITHKINIMRIKNNVHVPKY